jgi:hypothetical protein
MKKTIACALLLASGLRAQMHPSSEQKMAFAVGVSVGIAFHDQIIKKTAAGAKVTGKVLSAPVRAMRRKPAPNGPSSTAVH